MIATDASSAQVGSAAPHPGIEFTVARAEDSGIPAAAADLVTVAQALHWFDVDRFFAEALRVLRPGGVLAIWSYARCSVGAGCDAVIEDVFAEVEDYWPPERIIVENHYRDIDLPMPAVETPSFEMHVAWTADHMLDYMRTWSAASRYAAERGTDPVTLHEAALRSSWGEGSREVRGPLTIMAGRKPGASNE